MKCTCRETIRNLTSQWVMSVELMLYDIIIMIIHLICARVLCHSSSVNYVTQAFPKFVVCVLLGFQRVALERPGYIEDGMISYI